MSAENEVKSSMPISTGVSGEEPALPPPLIPTKTPTQPESTEEDTIVAAYDQVQERQQVFTEDLERVDIYEQEMDGFALKCTAHVNPKEAGKPLNEEISIALQDNSTSTSDMNTNRYSPSYEDPEYSRIFEQNQ